MCNKKACGMCDKWYSAKMRDIKNAICSLYAAAAICNISPPDPPPPIQSDIQLPGSGARAFARHIGCPLVSLCKRKGGENDQRENEQRENEQSEKAKRKTKLLCLKVKHR